MSLMYGYPKKSCGIGCCWTDPGVCKQCVYTGKAHAVESMSEEMLDVTGPVPFNSMMGEDHIAWSFCSAICIEIFWLIADWHQPATCTAS